METFPGQQQQQSQSSPSPPPSSAVPPPPPRDMNPFEEPAISSSPPAESATDNNSSSRARTAAVTEEETSVAPPNQTGEVPPTPKSPPPPVPSRGGQRGVLVSPPSDSAPNSPAPESPRTPMAPQSPPPPLPGSLASAAGGERILPQGSKGKLHGKRTALEETRLFEHRRNRHFGDKYSNDSLYWKCFVELIRRSQANNRRAINYAIAKLSATQSYAKALYSIRDHVDSLEEGTTEGRCETERRKKGKKVWPPPARSLVPSGGTEGTTPPSALDTLFIMEEHTAMRTLDMCDEARVVVIDKKLNAMVKSLDDRFSEMVGQGTACLRLMHSAEMNSSKAYSRYQEVVTQSLERESGRAAAKNILSSRDASSSDVWLADMNYRVAVTQQGRVWKGVSAKLAELFGKMKDIEVDRRQAIQSGLTVLMQMQDALWRDLPALKDPVLQTLSRINVDRHLLDQEVRKAMRTGAAKYLATRHDDTHAGGGASGGGANGNTSTGRTDGTRTADGPEETNADSVPSDFLSSLQSPLESSLIARSTMLERREKLMIASRWALVLAILTHDSYLLLFDVPKGTPAYKKQLNARTPEAFAELVPKPEVDAMAVELGKRKDSKGLDSSGLPIPPSVAIDLSACQVAFKPDGKSDATFEITEIKPARGMKSAFKNFEENKFTLRGRSQEAMVDWVCEIKEMGRAGMQEVEDERK